MEINVRGLPFKLIVRYVATKMEQMGGRVREKGKVGSKKKQQSKQLKMKFGRVDGKDPL